MKTVSILVLSLFINLSCSKKEKNEDNQEGKKRVGDQIDKETQKDIGGIQPNKQKPKIDPIVKVSSAFAPDTQLVEQITSTAQSCSSYKDVWSCPSFKVLKTRIQNKLAVYANQETRTILARIRALRTIFHQTTSKTIAVRNLAVALLDEDVLDLRRVLGNHPSAITTADLELLLKHHWVLDKPRRQVVLRWLARLAPLHKLATRFYAQVVQKHGDTSMEALVFRWELLYYYDSKAFDRKSTLAFLDGRMPKDPWASNEALEQFNDSIQSRARMHQSNSPASLDASCAWLVTTLSRGKIPSKIRHYFQVSILGQNVVSYVMSCKQRAAALVPVLIRLRELIIHDSMFSRASSMVLRQIPLYQQQTTLLKQRAELQTALQQNPPDSTKLQTKIALIDNQLKTITKNLDRMSRSFTSVPLP